ncbi:MAG: tautomerase family protein [Methanobacterium sp.]
MPVVQVNMWKGVSQEKIEYVIENITKVFVDLDIPADAVSVIVHEIPKEHWGEGGETCAVRFKDIEP